MQSDLLARRLDGMNASATCGSAGSEIPTALYQEACKKLLANAPMRAHSLTDATALPLVEVEVLQSVGLSTSPWTGSADKDPLLQSIADYMALLKTSLTIGEAAKRLKVGASRIRQRIREGSLYAIRYEARYRLPRFQFERRAVLPALREVISSLPQTLTPLDVARWFLTPHPDLEAQKRGKGNLTPRAWLLQGSPISMVSQLARAVE